MSAFRFPCVVLLLWSFLCPMCLCAPGSSIQAREGSTSSLPLRESARQPKQCGKMRAPALPTAVPTWARGDDAQVRRRRGVAVLTGGSGFQLGNEVVLRKCDFKYLERVVRLTRPAWRRTGRSTPKLAIFLDCGAKGDHVIKVEKTLEVGTGSKRSFGDFKLIAPGANVILDGRGKLRILRVHKFAALQVAGLTFRNGVVVAPRHHVARAQANTGGANGAAILVGSGATLIAKDCRFFNNFSRSFHARWGMGAAIKGEGKSAITVWGCEFQDNVAVGGGAIGVTGARLLYVGYSTFRGNTADGGVDSSSAEKSRHLKKDVIILKGGAIRVDSVTGHARSDEHVYICGSRFERNRLSLSSQSMSRFRGYPANDHKHVRASGAAIAAWNKRGTLLSSRGDHRFITVRGCTFSDNAENVHLTKGSNGWYVVDFKGAGDIEVADTQFTSNAVRKSVVSLGNGAKYETAGERFKIALSDLDFKRNPRVDFLHFETRTRCTVDRVAGLKSRKKGWCNGSARG